MKGFWVDLHNFLFFLNAELQSKLKRLANKNFQEQMLDYISQQDQWKQLSYS